MAEARPSPAPQQAHERRCRACGAGIATLPIARRGIEMTGVDLALPMLNHARRKAEAEGLRVTWVHDDVRSFHLDRRFRRSLALGR